MQLRNFKDALAAGDTPQLWGTAEALIECQVTQVRECTSLGLVSCSVGAVQVPAEEVAGAGAGADGGT